MQIVCFNQSVHKILTNQAVPMPRAMVSHKESKSNGNFTVYTKNDKFEEGWL